MDFISQHHQVPGLFAFPADDARADVVGIAFSGTRWRSRCRRTDNIRTRSILLLCPAHPLDSSGCGYCFAAAHGLSCAVAVHEPSRDESALAARICLESGIALS